MTDVTSGWQVLTKDDRCYIRMTGVTPWQQVLRRDDRCYIRMTGVTPWRQVLRRDDRCYIRMTGYIRMRIQNRQQFEPKRTGLPCTVKDFHTVVIITTWFLSLETSVIYRSEGLLSVTWRPVWGRLSPGFPGRLVSSFSPCQGIFPIGRWPPFPVCPSRFAA